MVGGVPRGLALHDHGLLGFGPFRTAITAYGGDCLAEALRLRK